MFALRNIVKSFGSNAILQSVTVEAEAGEFIALVGPSGCGKSTLLRIAAGLDHCDSGEIMLAGKPVTGLSASDRNVAMVFQSYALYPHLTAGQNIAVPLAMRELSTAQRLPIIGRFMGGSAAIRSNIQERVKDMGVSLKIDHLLDRKPGQMSGGQRQRVALARAMVRRPAVFLMDEPLSNLDANLRVHARGEIVDLHRKAGVPTLYVTHDQSEALSMADRVAVMIGGKMLQLDTPQTIYENPTHVEVARFIGQPRINLLESRVNANRLVRFGSVELVAPAAGENDTVTLGFRPEFVRLAAPGAGLSAQVERLEFLGSEIILFARLHGMGETIVVKLAPAEARTLTAGASVNLSVDPAHIMLFDGKIGARLKADVVEAPAHMKATLHG